MVADVYSAANVSQIMNLKEIDLFNSVILP